MNSSAVSRGDLLTALRHCGAVPPALAGRLCGFDFTEPEPLRLPVPEKGDAPSLSAPAPEPEPLPEPPALEGYPFWVAESLIQEPELTASQEKRPQELLDATPVTNEDFKLMDGQRPLPGRPLLPWSRLWPFLREVLGRRRPGHQPDIPAIIRLLARGRAFRELPRRLRRGWHPQVHLLRDRRLDLASFLDDYDYLVRRLKRMRGTGGLRVSNVEISPNNRFPSGFGVAGVIPWERDFQDLTVRRAGPVVLVLGDLQQFGAAADQQRWLRLGRRLRAFGVKAWVLCPCPRSAWVPSLARVWRMACWDRGQRLPPDGRGQRATPGDPVQMAARHAAGISALLHLCAPAVRVEPGLLRDLRFLLPEDVADAATEAALFRTYAEKLQGFTLRPEEVSRLRSNLVELSDVQLGEAIATLRRHHAYADHIFGCMEVIGLYGFLGEKRFDRLIADGVMPPDALERAHERLWRVAAACWHKQRGFMAEETATFSAEDAPRQSPASQALLQFQAFWGLAPHPPDEAVPAWVRPAEVERFRPPLLEEEHRTICLHGGIIPGGTRGSPLGWLRSRHRTFFATFHPMKKAGAVALTLELPFRRPLPQDRLDAAEAVTLASGGASLTLRRMERPAWAVRMGYDNRGPWAEPFGGPRLSWVLGNSSFLPAGAAGTFQGGFQATGAPCWVQFIRRDAKGWFASFPVGGAEFVLRWIPPGTFIMGSPPDEPRRDRDEGPQHEVTITRGFWLGETPVTQAQWRAIVHEAAKARHNLNRLSDSPSEFKGPDSLPVESVSWEDCSRAVEVLNALMADRLPPGFRFTLPSEAQWEYACRAGTDTALYSGPITINGDNDAPELDLIAWYGGNSGNDLEVTNPADSGWNEMQYPNPKSATHRVKLKKANPWGLHDMLGNVWEWCLDGMRHYDAAPVSDPVGPTGNSADRVLRGGSWLDLARSCRAAYRGHGRPGNHWPGAGFRLAAGQEPRAAEPQGPEGLGRKGGSPG
jgi:formylglycine-generating enzyme required for sulfatase activity